MKNERLIAYILIAVGVVTLLSRLGSADWLWIALVAAVLLAGYIRRENYGFLVAGAVMSGLAVGEMIGTLSGTLISLGAGFFVVDRLEPRPNRWALYLAGALAGVGLFVGLSNVLNSFWVAIVFIAGGAYLLLRGADDAPVESASSEAQTVQEDTRTDTWADPQTDLQGSADTADTTPMKEANMDEAEDAPTGAATGTVTGTAPAAEDASPKAAATEKTERPAENVSPALDEPALSADEEERYHLLEVWRKEAAKSEGRPAYIILRNESLRQIAQQNPQTLDELSKVKGIGPVKLERYGDTILGVLRGERPPEEAA